METSSGNRFNYGFQSYQFRQINPDVKQVTVAIDCSGRFQSYQFRQINPDISGKEIVKKIDGEFQSYQFRQINPDNVVHVN